MEHNLGERVCHFPNGAGGLAQMLGEDRRMLFDLRSKSPCHANRSCTSARVTYRADNAGEARPMMDVPFTCETGIRL